MEETKKIAGPETPFSTGGKMVILGGGESGVGAAILGKQKGYQVFLSEAGSIRENYRKDLIENNIEFEEGGHSEGKVLNADEVVKSPGIPEKNGLVKELRAKGIPIISE